MSDPSLPPPPERPRIHGFWNWLTIVLAVLTWLVLVFQAWVMSRQTKIMAQQADIIETQHKLAARPNVVTSLDGYIWKIENKGPYSVRDLRLRVLHFKKFLNLGWHDQISNEKGISDVLEAGQGMTVNLRESFFEYSITGYTPVRFAEFYVVALVFKREVDDKRYLYLQPFQVSMGPGEPPKEITSDLTSTAGPVDKACMMDAYAVELAYEFYKRNPLPYPVEPYNYHYLLGVPTTTCLQTGPQTLRW